MSTRERVYRVCAVGLFALVVFQVATAGTGAFRTSHAVDEARRPLRKAAYDGFWSLHATLGITVALAAIALFALAYLARVPTVRVCFALAAAAALQAFLAGLAVRVPETGLLHAANALLIVALAGYLANRARPVR